MAKSFGKVKRNNAAQAKAQAAVENKVNAIVEVATTVKEVLDAGRQDFLLQGLENGTITKENFLSMADEFKLPEEIIKNPLVILALNYDCNSKVGSWTNKAMNICTALPEEFLNENGIGANKKFMKAFTCATKTGKKKHYTSMFQEGLNIHTVAIWTGEKYEVEVYYVSDREIDAFAEEIASLDLSTLTLEDIKNIQNDLWFLFRAWQESSIDMTKDKDKQFGISMDEVLGYIKVRTGVKFQDIQVNNYEIKRAKYDKTVAVENIPGLEINFAEYDDDDDDEFLETSLSEMQHEIRIVAEEQLQVFTNAYVNDANVSELESYIRFAMDHPKLAVFIMNAYKVIKDYNNVSKEEKDAGKKLTSKDYALLRAMVYNEARNLDVALEDVCAVGLGVAASAGVYVSRHTGEEVVQEFDAKRASSQLYCAERLFGNMVVLEKGIMYGSDMIVDGLYIKQEVEVKHVFSFVANGRYSVNNGDVTDANGNLIFDLRQQELTGEVVVEDDGVYFLYDPLTEIDNAPSIDAVFIDETAEEEDCDDDDVARYFESVLKGRANYTISGDSIIIENEEVAYVDADYAIPADTEEERVLSKWYGISGVRWNGEEPIFRSNQFLLLSYNIPEVEAYLNSITEFIK